MTARVPREAKSLFLAFALVATGCTGDGCLAPIPGGFPAEDRIDNAVQIRITDRGVSTIENSVGTVAGELLPGGLAIDIPPDCDSNPKICCGAAPGECRIELDLEQRADEPLRLDLDPRDLEPGTMGMTLRARIRTPNRLAIRYRAGIITAACRVEVNTERSGTDWVTVDTVLRFHGDPVTGNTRVSFGDVSIDDLANGDIDIDGDIFCNIADLFKGLFIGSLKGALEDQASGLITQQLCKTCSSNDECAPYGTCDGNGVCMVGSGDQQQCMQELGMVGRAPITGLIDGAVGGGALDLYLAAGGHYDTAGGGLTLGFQAGARPGGGLACGPSAPQPPIPTDILPVTELTGNTLPDGTAYDFGFGLHQAFFEHLLWTVHETGAMCLGLDTDSVDLLNSDTLSLIVPSLNDVLFGKSAKARLALRPQKPATVALGEGTTDGSGNILEPHLLLTLPELEMDFLAQIDERMVRMFTARLDLALPLNLESDGSGGLTPIIGDIEQSFTSAEITTTGVIAEDEAFLRERLPALIGVALPALTGSLGAVELPEIAGLAVTIPEGGIRAVADKKMLGIFGALQPTTTAALVRADTTAEVVRVEVPPRASYAAPVLDRAERPSVRLRLGGTDRVSGPLEWQIRVDGGPWSPFTRDPVVDFGRDILWLAGTHRIEVRARLQGHPATVDPTPTVLEVEVAPEPAEAAPAGGCTAAGGATGAGLAVLLLLALAVRARRVLLFALTAITALAGCGSSDGGQQTARESVIGRWTDMAADDTRVVVSAYEQLYGDLVFGELQGEGDIVFRPIDGVPAADPVDPEAYRGGVTAPGDDVGAWSTIGLVGGTAVIAYQGVTDGTLRVAVEQADGSFVTHVVDSAPDGPVGRYASLVTDGTTIGVAYMAENLASDTGGFVSQLRWAQATGLPTGGSSWTVETVVEGPASCAGLCGGGTACVTASNLCEATDDSCGDCGDGTACVGGACVPVSVRNPNIDDLASGTGLFTSAVLAGGQPAIAYYDRNRGALDLALRGPEGWTSAPLDEGDGADVGRFASAVADASGIIHVAYLDVSRERLRYVARAPDGRISVVESVATGDDGSGQSHPVGASASIVLDAAGAPRIAYQDMRDTQVAIAQRVDVETWASQTLSEPPASHGFFVATARKGDELWVASYGYDHNFFPPGSLDFFRMR